ncbi:MAG: fenitrothion hydrolase, partial [Actinobacteria bacterium]|nr:fenitrothion hydrolase [Actinomycetota bacterium]
MLAHGIGGVRDLPVPTWLFIWGAAVVLVLSFLLLGTLWKRSQLERRAEGRPLPQSVERILRSSALRVLLGAVSAGLLVLVFLTALLGESSSATNLAPTFVYVVFWLGLVPLQVVLGNVWPALNPWLAIASAASWIWRLLGRTWNPIVVYPERLGVYPAALLLFAFVALELCYVDPANPRALALAIALYSYATWFGMAAVGRRLWAERGEAFTVYFGLIGRIAPFGERNGRLVTRMPFSGLAGSERQPGTLAVVAVMLGSVGFDGLSRSAAWQDLRSRVEGPYVLDSPGVADLVGTLLALVGLVGCIAVVALAFLAAMRLAQRAAESGRPLGSEFVQSLVPIALVYAVAHYFTLLVDQGQFALPLASD